MAGSPKKRARREAQRREVQAAAAAPVTGYGPNPAAPAIPDAVTRDTRARTRPGEPIAQGAAPLRSAVYPGRGVRSLTDSAEVAQLEALAAVLPSAIAVRIWRVAPHWCKGFLEDYMLDTSNLGEFLRYLKDEHGGTDYQVQALGPNGLPIFTARVPIGAQPKEAGRILDRYEYENREQAARAPAIVAQGGRGDSESAGLVKLVFDELRSIRNVPFETLKDATERNQRTIADLLKTIVSSREKAATEADPAEGIRKLRNTVTAIADLKDIITPEPTTAAAPTEDKTVLQKAAEAMAVKMFADAFNPQGQGAAPPGIVPPGMVPGSAGAPVPIPIPIPDARKPGN